MSDELHALKARLKSTWMAGDFGQIARYSQPAADEFIARRGLGRLRAPRRKAWKCASTKATPSSCRTRTRPSTSS
jgi:hypothetical protein